MTAGEIIRTARKRKGLTMKQLAAKSGVSLPTIWNIENTRTTPTMDTMLAIMRAMDYDIVFKPKYKGGYYGDE